MVLLSKFPVQVHIESEDLSPFAVSYSYGNSKTIIKTFKFLLDLLHNQYNVSKLSREDKKILGRRSLYAEIDVIFQYEETYSWLLALTRNFYIKNVAGVFNNEITKKQVNRYYYLISNFPPKVLDRHTASPTYTYSLISSLV